MTKEHYMSRTILDKLGGGNLRISGFPWLSAGEERDVSPKGMSARVLCGRHNNALSPLDAEAGRFFETLAQFLREMTTGERQTTWGLFSGHDLERWFVKVFYGGMAAGVWSDLVHAPNWTAPVAGLSALFCRGPWSRRTGLYIPMHQPIFIEHWNKVAFNACLNDDAVIQGVVVQLADIPFLCLDQPPTFKSTYRPPAVVIRKGSDLRRLIFSWEDGAAPGHLVLNVHGERPAPSSP
jgi:hypothetical protein